MTSDRVCGTVRSCNALNEYMAATPTVTSNRVCQELTRCDPGSEYVNS